MSSYESVKYDGFIAFLDLLGFTERVRTGDVGKSFEKYSEIIQQSLKTKESNLQYITFSDSIVVTTNGNDSEQLLVLVEALAELQFRLLIEFGSPVRGCVSVGEYSRERKGENVLIAGFPLIDAYGYENVQDWMGIMLSPSVVKRIPELKVKTLISESERPDTLYKQLKWSLNLQRYMKIPFKEGSYFDGFTIVPHQKTVELPEKLIKNLNDYCSQLDVLKLFSSSSDTQIKYVNSLRFICEMIERYKSTFNRVGWESFLSDTKKEK